MDFKDKLILALLREAKKDEDDDPEVEEIFGIPMRRHRRPSDEEMKKIKGKPRSKGAWSDEKRKFKRSMGEIPPEDPNEVDEVKKPKLPPGWSTAVGRRGGLIRKIKSGEKEGPGLEGTGRTAFGELGAGTVGDRDRLKAKLIAFKKARQSDDIHSAFTAEGKSTGGDMEATAERLGKWDKSIDPKAKPGEKGYLRKRNVPPTDPKLHASKYDPTKHEAPEEGKPLRYMKPQHKDYARVGVHNKITTMAIRKTEREEGDEGRPTNIHKRHKEKMERFDAHSKKGIDILKKHGIPNPSLAQRYAKWIQGNSPHSKENPEGYIRSDGKKD